MCYVYDPVKRASAEKLLPLYMRGGRSKVVKFLHPVSSYTIMCILIE